MDATRGANKRDNATITIRWQQEEKYRNSQLAHGWTRILPIPGRRSTFLTSRPGSIGTGTRALLCWRVTHKIAKLDRREHEKLSKPLRKFSQVVDKNRDDRFLLFRRTREQGKGHSMKIASEIRMDESKLEDVFRAIFFLFIIFTKKGGNTNMNSETLNGVDTKTPKETVARHRPTRPPMERSER